MRGVVAIFLLILISCNPHVDIDNIGAQRLIAISCTISPQDTLLRAYVFRASTTGSTVKYDSAAVKDALVTISDGQKYDTLLLTHRLDSNLNIKIYRYEGKSRNIKITASSTYYLDVSTPGGDHVSALCSIPPLPGKPSMAGVKINNDFDFAIHWSNAPLYKYFLMILQAKGSYDNPNPGGSGRFDLEPSLTEDLAMPCDKQVLDNSYNGVLPNAYLCANPRLVVSIRNIDEGLYNYYTSFQQYEQWDLNTNSGGLFPNFKEMPQIYSNINGGVGIFGGVNTSIDSVAIN